MIGEGSTVSGLVLMDGGFDPIGKRINLFLSPRSMVTGIVYCNGIVNMNGSIAGSIYCNLFILKTPSAIYENNLLNSVIDISKLPVNFSIKNFLKTKTQSRVIKWV